MNNINGAARTNKKNLDGPLSENSQGLKSTNHLRKTLHLRWSGAASANQPSKTAPSKNSQQLKPLNILTICFIIGVLLVPALIVTSSYMQPYITVLIEKFQFD